MGVVGSKDPLAIGKDSFIQRDGLIHPPRRLVSVGEIVTGGQGVGVVGSKDPLAIGEGSLVQRDGLIESPRRLVCWPSFVVSV